MKLTCYPTYGYKDQDGAWRISVRVWVYESRPNEPLIELLLSAVELTALTHHKIDHENVKRIFKERLDCFWRHGVPDQEVGLEFRDTTNSEKRYKVPRALTTDESGVVSVDLTLTEAEVPWLAGKGDRWLNYQCSVVGPEGVDGPGKVRLLDAQGVSVISDIDDTIKITEIPAGAEIVGLNTFFRDFASVEQPSSMLSMYNGGIRTPGGFSLEPEVSEVTSFHYVSGGPWQLYEPLSDYLIEKSRFPSGTFHLRTVDLERAAHEQWKNLVDLAERAFSLAPASPKAEENDTYKHKLSVIHQLMTALPGRKFLMFGDSGEFDPEVYEEILSEQKFRPMVMETSIRDVKDLAHTDVSRLQRMKEMRIIVCAASPILKGRSQFD